MCLCGNLPYIMRSQCSLMINFIPSFVICGWSIVELMVIAIPATYCMWFSFAVTLAMIVCGWWLSFCLFGVVLVGWLFRDDSDGYLFTNAKASFQSNNSSREVWKLLLSWNFCSFCLRFFTLGQRYDTEKGCMSSNMVAMYFSIQFHSPVVLELLRA